MKVAISPFSEYAIEVPQRRLESFELSIRHFHMGGIKPGGEPTTMRLLRFNLEIGNRQYQVERPLPDDDSVSLVEYTFDMAKAVLLQAMRKDAV